jgi:hypothetical protein
MNKFQAGDAVIITQDRDAIGVKKGTKGKVTGPAGLDAAWVRFDGKTNDVIVPENILTPDPGPTNA